MWDVGCDISGGMVEFLIPRGSGGALCVGSVIGVFEGGFGRAR